MITISKNDEIPDFSTLEVVNTRPGVRLCPLGESIVEELGKMCAKFAELEVYTYVVMPDHIHFVLNVSSPTEYHLGKAIGDFMGACSRAFWRLAEICPERKPVFKRGFHDRILTGRGQYQTMKNYIRDNPRRLYIKRTCPDLFRSRHTIRINDEEFDALGNIFLLRNPEIETVQVSSTFSMEQLKNLDHRWIRTIENGGVLVSPFISPKEKVYLELAISNGANIILIDKDGFGERYKPSGRYFDLCASGRLLIIAPKKEPHRSQKITRSEALHMNSLAVAISGGCFSAVLHR